MTVEGGRGGKRRIDRIMRPEFAEGLGELTLEELRSRRDECMAERENLSLLRRLLQGRAEILKAELEGRRSGDEVAPLVQRLSEILSPDMEQPSPSRGEALRVGVPEEEVALARRRVERLVADAGISDPSVLSDERVKEAVEVLVREEREVSTTRAGVIGVLDRLQDELKRRYKQDISQVLES